MKTLLVFSFGLCLSLLFLAPGKAAAQDFVYTPKNPAFGGNYLNYSWLLNSANAQNKYEDGRGFRIDDPLDDFERSLQRQVLSHLTRDIIRDRFGEIDFSERGSFEFGEFSVDIFPGPNGIEISILNITTGETTTVTIPHL